MNTVLTQTDIDELSGLLADKIDETGRCEEIEHRERIFVFSGKVSQQTQRVLTGVEFLGVKESYIKTKKRLDFLTLEGTYDHSGKEISRITLKDLSSIKDAVNEKLRS